MKLNNLGFDESLDFVCNKKIEKNIKNKLIKYKYKAKKEIKDLINQDLDHVYIYINDEDMNIKISKTDDKKTFRITKSKVDHESNNRKFGYLLKEVYTDIKKDKVEEVNLEKKLKEIGISEELLQNIDHLTNDID